MNNYFNISNNKNALFEKECVKEGCTVSRHKSLMSDNLKAEIAKELGVYDTVKSEGWGAVSSRYCGNIVRKAIEMAERNVNKG